MKIKQFAVGAVALGLLMPRNASKKTCVAIVAACNKAWLSNTAKLSACPGKAILTTKHLLNQYLTVNYFCQVNANATTMIA